MSGCTAQDKFALVVHGGAHAWAPEDRAREDFVRTLLEAARADLASGAASLDVVENAVAQMEDSGLFNAGRGSNANAAGFIETDAAIMDGRDQSAGAVASMRALRNPVRAARLVLRAGGPVLLVGDRGEAHVLGLGAQQAPARYFLNEGRANQSDGENGTVGAVALDRCGAIAAATSTGGFGAKIPGRVGDSPIIGAGVFADARVGLSSTGMGEAFLRFAAAKDVADRVRYGGQTLRAAASAVIMEEFAALPAEAGLIGVDRNGAIVMMFNTSGMVRGYVSDREAPVVASREGSMGNAPS